MFERYTEKVRRVIFFARWEAGKAGAEFIEPEHILLGLLEQDRPLFDRLVGEQAGSLHLQLVFGPEPAAARIEPQVDMALSEGARRVLEHAAEEADALHEREIDSTHLLLAILREPGRAREALDQYRVTAEKVRDEISTHRTKQRFDELRRCFSPLAAQLTHEHEPAFTFLP